VATRPLRVAAIGAFTTLPVVAAIIVAAETGPALARYISLAGAALGALALAAGGMASLRIAAALQDDDA
jgi:hypothetical protein